jgi:murein L,D-transpeptidase YafK
MRSARWRVMAAFGLSSTLALSILLSLPLSGPHSEGSPRAPFTPDLASISASVGEATVAGKTGKTAPAVTEIRIDKSDHTLKLVAGSDVVKTYKVAIGGGGMGPKQYEGDRTTPTGTYRVAGRFKGLYRQFLNVSYPNDEDKKRFAALKAKGGVPAGRSVGFGIGIHGVGQKAWNGVHKATDWTAGCIALDDAEIDELSGMVKDGTKIVITD